MLKQLLFEEDGAVLSAELVLILTILVIGVIVGLSELAVAINTELNDISNAIGALNQGYAFTGFHAYDGKFRSIVFGSRYNDNRDDGDNNNSCDLVCGVPLFSGESSGGIGGGFGGGGR